MNTDWKEMGIIAGIVLVGSFLACYAAIKLNESLEKSEAEKKAKKAAKKA